MAIVSTLTYHLACLNIEGDVIGQTFGCVFCFDREAQVGKGQHVL